MGVILYTLLYSVLCFSQVLQVSGVSTPTLSFVIEDKPITISLSVQSSRVSLIYPLNTTETKRREAFIKAKELRTTYRNLAMFTDENLKSEFKESLETAAKDYSQAGTHMKHLYSFLVNVTTPDVQPKSACTFYGSYIDDTQLSLQTGQLEKLFTRIKGGNPTEGGSETNVNRIYNFINLYQGIATEWLDMGASIVSQWDSLRGGKFPDDLLGHIETVECLDSTKFEKIEVLECGKGENALICELEVSFPTQVQSYFELQPITYNKVRISGPEKHSILVKSLEGQSIHALTCSSEDILQVSESVPLCKENTDYANCIKNLLHQDLDDTISTCKFSFVDETPLAIRLSDDGILIQGSDIQIANDGKIIFEALPLVIYPANRIVITQKGEEHTFLSGTKAVETRILSTKLTKLQISNMYYKALYEYYLANFDILEYTEHVALILQLLSLPLILSGFILAVRNKINLRINQKKVEKEFRKRNFEENQKLLKGTLEKKKSKK